jgi:ribonucleoside-diphosphate reductase alpha chain
MHAAAERQRLPNRRPALTWDIQVGGLRYTTTVGFYPDGKIGEIFIQNHKQGSQAGVMASDSAVLCSLLLQHAVPLDVIRHALMRDSRGKPSGPLGVVLDQLAQERAS